MRAIGVGAFCGVVLIAGCGSSGTAPRAAPSTSAPVTSRTSQVTTPTPAAGPELRSCYFFLGFRSVARANAALLLDGNGNTWLYDGSTAHVAARHVTASW